MRYRAPVKYKIFKGHNIALKFEICENRQVASPKTIDKYNDIL